MGDFCPYIRKRNRAKFALDSDCMLIVDASQNTKLKEKKKIGCQGCVLSHFIDMNATPSILILFLVAFSLRRLIWPLCTSFLLHNIFQINVHSELFF